MKRNISTVILGVMIGLNGCDVATDNKEKTNDSANGASSQQQDTSVIKVQNTKPAEPEVKDFLDEQSFRKLDSHHQYNLIHFKFNRDPIKNPEALNYWVGINNCEKLKKLNDEFEWPSIKEKYTNAIDTVLDKIPTDLSITLSGYLGQYDMTSKSFPVLPDYDKNIAYNVENIQISDKNGSICGPFALPIFYRYILSLTQPVIIPKIDMDEAQAKDYVANHTEPYTRKVIIKIDSVVTGLQPTPKDARQVMSEDVTFRAIPQKITLLDDNARDKVIHEFKIEVAE